ncbi:hypothetical protein DS228_12190, partial [Salmonella enterica subsp. enterica]|nr:hypothetical protein [Salmonella enterica subsp. enterica]
PTGVRQLAQPVGQTGRAANGLPEGRAQRVNPPLTAIFKLRACTEVRAFCLYVTRRLPDDDAIYKRLVRLPRAQRHQANY